MCDEDVAAIVIDNGSGKILLEKKTTPKLIRMIFYYNK
jgi:hypothetical protein